MLRNIINPRISENIRAVALFLSLCATKFFSTSYFVVFFSNINKKLAANQFVKDIKLFDKIAKAKIIPNKITMKIDIANEKLKLTKAKGIK